MDGYDYGEGGYKPVGSNVGFDEATGQFHIEIKGLVEPESAEAARICQEDINEVITAFVQDPRTVERGLFDEDVVPEELTQLKMGDIVKEKYSELTETDHEAIRQRAVAALTLVQQAREAAEGGTTAAAAGGDGGDEPAGNTAFIDGVRRFRVANAKADPTFLFADVDIVATYKLININRAKLEALLHRFFAAARLDVELPDRFGRAVKPREWFLVPLHIIDEVVARIKDQSITLYVYSPQEAALKKL